MWAFFCEGPGLLAMLCKFQVVFIFTRKNG